MNFEQGYGRTFVQNSAKAGRDVGLEERESMRSVRIEKGGNEK